MDDHLQKKQLFIDGLPVTGIPVGSRTEFNLLLQESAINRAWRINRINKINNIHRVNNGLINRCKFGLGLIWINNRLIRINRHPSFVY